MPFDFDRLVSLRSDSAAFEAERTALISELMEGMPVEQRAKCEALQRELDQLRGTLSSEAFLAELFRRMQENIADIGDQASAIQVILEKGSDDQPRLVNIKNRVAFVPAGFTFTPPQGKMNS